MLLQGLVLVALLIGSNPEVETPDPDTAPTAPEWPADRPTPLSVPTDARCQDSSSEIGPGVYLPDKLAGIINGRLEALTAYPSRCQLRMDWLKDRCALDIRHAVDVARAEIGVQDLTEEIKRDPGWSTWSVVGMLSGALAVGIAGGLGVGLLAR